MIYHIYFSQAMTPIERVTVWNHKHYPTNKVGDPVPGLINRQKEFADFIKSSKDDSFVFILVDKAYNHLVAFNDWVKEHDLKDYIVVRTGLSNNPIHPGNGYNLQLVVMQSLDHFQRQEKEVKNEVQAWC